MQPLLGNDGIHLVCIFRAVPFGSGERGGFLASREAWSDIRRTGYPSGLAFPEVAGTITNVPNRWRYPNTEVNYNPYYKEVSAEDTYYHKLFWAK